MRYDQHDNFLTKFQKQGFKHREVKYTNGTFKLIRQNKLYGNKKKTEIERQTTIYKHQLENQRLNNKNFTKTRW